MISKILLLTLALHLSHGQYLQDGKVVTKHLPTILKGSLHLTPAEMKQFGGHALALVQAKCPKINGDTIVKLQHYIGKTISKMNPIRPKGENRIFRMLMDELQNCTQQPIRPKFHPSGRSFADLFPILFLSTSEDSSEKKPMASADPNKEHKSDEEDGDMIIVEVIDDSPPPSGLRPSGGPFNFFSSIFSSISSMFWRLFGLGGPSGSSRLRRSLRMDDILIVDEPESTVKVQDEGVEKDLKKVVDSTVIANKKEHQKYHNHKKVKAVKHPEPSKGQKTLATIFDEICEIYCEQECVHHGMKYEFMLGIRDILTFFFQPEEQKGLDMAMKHLVDETFIQSLLKCEQ